jgi:hypothetical protein
MLKASFANDDRASRHPSLPSPEHISDEDLRSVAEKAGEFIKQAPDGGDTLRRGAAARGVGRCCIRAGQQGLVPALQSSPGLPATDRTLCRSEPLSAADRPHASAPAPPDGD